MIEAILISLSAGACIGVPLGALVATNRWLGYIDHAVDLATAADEQKLRRQGREIADLRAEIFAMNAIERARTSGLRAANAKRSADATAARHARMEVADQRLAMKEAAE